MFSIKILPKIISIIVNYFNYVGSGQIENRTLTTVRENERNSLLFHNKQNQCAHLELREIKNITHFLLLKAHPR